MESQEKKSNTKKRTGRLTKRIIKGMWISFATIIIALFIIFCLIYNGIIGYMPPIEELKNPTDRYATVLYTADGVEMGRYYQSMANRVFVDFDELSPHLTNALIATEDERFLSHSGIDFKALLRAVVKRGLLGQKNAGGGSTITQQLAKQLYSPDYENMFQRMLQKPIEWAIAVKLERYYTKDEIIQMYFNQFDFLNNAVGIESACYVYFGKSPSDVSIEEAATLVGMVKNPSLYNPVRYNQRTRERRNVVLDQMCRAGMITEAEAEELKAKPLVLDYHRVDHKDGIAPYFREELRRMLSAKYPERFIGAASYDPFCAKVEDVKRHLFGELGFRAVKFEVSNGSGLMAYHPPIDLNGEIMNAQYRYAADNGLTFVIDIGRPRNCCWQTDALAAAAKNYPSLTFVICHLLAPQRTDAELMKVELGKFALPNVYFDLASLAANQQPESYPYPTAAVHLNTARQVLGADRLMFGTDMPSNLCRDSYAHLKDYIAESGVFTSAELEDVFYNTAERVYFSRR